MIFSCHMIEEKIENTMLVHIDYKYTEIPVQSACSFAEIVDRTCWEDVFILIILIAYTIPM